MTVTCFLVLSLIPRNMNKTPVPTPFLPQSFKPPLAEHCKSLLYNVQILRLPLRIILRHYVSCIVGSNVQEIVFLQGNGRFFLLPAVRYYADLHLLLLYVHRDLKK